MSELKPCPSCGSTNVAIHKDVYGNFIWWGACYDCDLNTKGCDTEEQAIAAWNRRAESPELSAALESVRRRDEVIEELAVIAARGGDCPKPNICGPVCVDCWKHWIKSKLEGK